MLGLFSHLHLLTIGLLRTYNKYMKIIQTYKPLTPAVFYILLALARKEMHGYEIMKQVRNDSSGKISMGNGTLYGSLKRMLEDQLIEESEEKKGVDAVPRKYYRITKKGSEALGAEVQRMNDITLLVQSSNLSNLLSIQL